jgi:hypothetical protein
MLLASLFSCKKAHEPEGYRVVSYDAASQQWTIIRNGTFDGKYMKKKLVIICTFYKWGEHEAVQGPDACHLQVGRLIVPNPMPDGAHRNQFVDVFEMPSETLSITEGDGEERVMQQFKILSYSVEGQ